MLATLLAPWVLAFAPFGAAAAPVDAAPSDADADVDTETPAPDRDPFGPGLLGPPPDPDGGAPIMFGAPESEYPSAVGLGAGGFTLCTGSLIAPRVVLTAAHCSADLPFEAVVKFGQAYVGENAATPDAALRFSGAEIHPDYVALTQFQLGQNDVAVLFLEEDAPMDPVWFRTEPLRPRDIGDEVVSVGWGVDENGVAGIKRSAVLTVSDLDDTFLFSDSYDNANGANVCSGDSGGPQYHVEDDGTLVQWSVHSWADVNCRFQSGSTRVDTVSEWILDQVEAEHGTRDQCAIFGRYDDGVCDPACDEVDRDCFELEPPPLVAGGCTTAAPPRSAAALLGLALLVRRRARQPGASGVPAKATTIENSRRRPSPT